MTIPPALREFYGHQDGQTCFVSVRVVEVRVVSLDLVGTGKRVK